jgi:two-component system nitrate/nitrite response regulator NarL
MARTVLIVDDHARFRRSARALLEFEGFEVVGEAATGEEAVALVADLAPQTLLLDVQLPDVDGFEVAARLRRTSRAPEIVFVSNRDPGDYGTKIAASGARGFIAKGSLSAETLRHCLG